MKYYLILLILSVFGLLLASVLPAAEVKLVYKYTDGKTETKTAELTQKNNIEYLKIAKETVPEGVQHIEVHHPAAEAKTGDVGFYVFSNGQYGTFKERANGAYTLSHKYCPMPLLGIKTPQGTISVILTGMRYEADYLVILRDGVYRIFPRFILDGDKPYDDIALEFHQLGKDATYSDIAKEYRKFQLDNGRCVPLKERVKNNPVLGYAAQAMEVRVRLGWKPVPSPVKEQTAENEPPMHTAITFDRFKQIVDEFKKQGVTKAQFCLVGWNIGGHDGRYPQIFPVDERLGGEAKLREAIKHAQDNGYQVVCHTNNSDAYHASSIGGLWDENFLLRKKDGNLNTYTTWGGGNMYETCPKQMYERFVKSDYQKLKELGFRGLHYVDVFSTVAPRTCYSKEHPLTKEGYAHWTKQIFKEAQNTFGGLASEGGFDYCIENLDYGLYISFYNPETPVNPMLDRHIPFWHLVYNGIILNTPYTAAVNYTIKSPLVKLKLVEFGGRPIFYFYSKFRSSGNNWMGDDDLTCATDEELVKSVQNVKKGFDEFETLKRLQYETMEEHTEIADKIFKSVFSDGTSIISNYGDADALIDGKTVKPMSYIVNPPRQQ